MIYKEFEQSLTDIDKMFARSKSTADRSKRMDMRIRVHREFADALVEEYAKPVLGIHLASVAKPLYDEAWDRGHSEGLMHVEQEYEILVDLVASLARLATGRS